MKRNKKCEIGDSVQCLSGEMCAGNQCCADGSTCPSADNNYNLCRLGKLYDCTSGVTPTQNFVCPSKQCCEVGKSQQCCAVPDPSGSGGCKRRGEWCDEIYRAQPNRCGQTSDGRIICDCQGGKLPPINPSCCEKAGGKRGREGKCIFDNMLQCAHALNCDIDPDPSGVKPLQCTKDPGIGVANCKVDCKECQGQPLGTRCVIPGSGGQIGGCYQTEYPDGDCGKKGLWECLPANVNCKMTGFYDDCTFDGRCNKKKRCTEAPWSPSECDTGTCSSLVPGQFEFCKSFNQEQCKKNFLLCNWKEDTEDEKNACCQRLYGDQAKWNPKTSYCDYPCRKHCSFIGDEGKSFLNCEG